jgi:MFS family permease
LPCSSHATAMASESKPATPTSNATTQVSSPVDLEKAVEEHPRYFKSWLHEAAFICVRSDHLVRACLSYLVYLIAPCQVVTSAQTIAQLGLGCVVLPIRQIADKLGVTREGDLAWFLASYSCTVGAFVLIQGRLGDLYGKKTLFTLGYAWLAIFSIMSGFVRSPIAFDVARALTGIGCSALMPNAAA